MTRRGAGRSRYGKTWWGDKFLGAFDQVDHANRLPRGVTYANNGSCSRVRICGGTVTAEVQGSEYRPYQVRSPMILGAR